MFEYSYHQRLRKSVALFGTLFNNIYVIRKDASGKSISQVKVPLAYAPKDKYLERIRTSPDLTNDTKVALKLPRISFEITSIAYDPERKLPKLNHYDRNLTQTQRNKFFAPSPYQISFQLNVYAKNQDDALQIVEQILPYFNPQYTVSIKPFTDSYPDIIEDVPITIQGVNFSDDFEGTLESRRTIIYTLDFGMSVNFYGPINSQKVIRRSETVVNEAVDFSISTDPKLERIITTPNPIDVNPDDDYGFDTSIVVYDNNPQDLLSSLYVEDDYVFAGYVDSSGA